MMKKKYVSPVTGIFASELSGVLCNSKLDINGGAAWGAGNSQYSNPDWDNEGHNQEQPGGGGYVTEPIENDDEDIYSRSKGASLWDDF